MQAAPTTPPPDPFAPARLGPIALRNRIVKAATFEGMSPNNLVTDTLIEFHRRMAGGGVALTTVSYVAVSRDGMGAPAEIYIHPEAAPGLARIAEVVHGEGAAISAQLGHAGAVGVLPGKRTVGPSRGFTWMGARVHEISLAGIDEVVEQFAAGGRMLAQAGFDAIELHFGHHYLISSFLSPKWNRRRDDYGGSLENRARLARRVLRAVREAAGPRIAITAKLNMVDGVRGGLAIEDSLAAASLFESEGVLDALEAHERRLAGEPDVHVPRRRAARRDGEGAAACAAPRLPAVRPRAVPRLSVRGGLLPADGAALPRSAVAAADPARRHQHGRDDPSRRWPRASTSSRWGARCCAIPRS
jgi:2,4-dienoyl-CoA reductase-like NADH-dependent reductase (Old Yellow Enzyme family)